MTLAEINRRLKALASELKVELVIFQSNHEGALVDKLQEFMDSADGAVLNPGGLTQHGVSLHDCIKAMPFPVIEAHMSNLAAREEWRRHSIISPAVKGTVQGLGWRSYSAALRAVVELAREAKRKISRK
jgi:3-dehydroquinate dehydratase-2